MKHFIGGLIGLGVGVIGYKLFERYRNEKDFDDFMESIFGEDDEEDENGARYIEYSVGDFVLISDPHDPHGELQAKRGIIEEIRLGEGGHIYVFKIEGDPLWYNQNWLMPDVVGPMTWNPHTANPTEVDYWLATLSDSKRAGDESGAAEASEELRKLIGGEVD